MTQAEKFKNDTTLAELKAIAPYPGNQPIARERIITARKWVQYYGGLLPEFPEVDMKPMKNFLFRPIMSGWTVLSATSYLRHIKEYKVWKLLDAKEEYALLHR